MVAIRSSNNAPKYQPKTETQVARADIKTEAPQKLPSTESNTPAAKPEAYKASPQSGFTRAKDMRMGASHAAMNLHAQFDANKTAANDASTAQAAANDGSVADKAKDLIDSHRGGLFNANLDEQGLGRDLAGQVAADPKANGPVANEVYDQLSGNRLFGDDKQQVARAFTDSLTDQQMNDIAATPEGVETLTKTREMLERGGVEGDEVAQVARLNDALRPDDIDGIVNGLQNGRIDDDMRAAIADHFGPLGLDGSKESMDKIRDAGLMDQFLDATLRTDDGAAIDPQLKSGIADMMNTGRLDSYAETLATHGFNVFDPANLGDVATDAHHFNPSTGGVYIRQDGLGDADSLKNILAHETFHAYAHDHGSSRGANDEGLGIAAARYANTDDDYNVAEMVYGTKNFYRDIRGDADFPMGDWSGADPELREFVGELSSRDSSGFAWDDPTTAQQEYDDFFAPINRNQDWNSWLLDVDQATNDMIDARAP